MKVYVSLYWVVVQVVGVGIVRCVGDKLDIGVVGEVVEGVKLEYGSKVFYKDGKYEVSLNTGNSLDLYVYRIVDAKVGRSNNDRVYSDIDAKVGSYHGEVVE